MTVDMMTADASNIILQQCANTLWGAQTEIALFFIALITHAVIFGKHRVIQAKTGKKLTNKSNRARSPSPEQTKNGNKFLTQAPRSPRSEHAKAMASAADSICRSGGDVQSVKMRLDSELEKIPQDGMVQALSSLMESAGRSATAELLESVRCILKEKNLQINAGLGELMLRCCLGLQLMTEFEEVLKQVESAHGSFASISFLALKAALRANNFESAMDRFEGLHSFWQEEETPSAAPTAVLRQLVRLAVQNNALPTLLHRLYTLELMAESVNVILADCVQRNDLANLKAAENLARAQGVQLTGITFATLVKGCQDSTEATRYVKEAVSLRAFSKEVLIAASEKAMALNDEVLARLVLANFPGTSPPVDVAGKLLRSLSKERPDASGISDAKLIQLYKQYLSKVDLAGDPDSESLIAEVALRCGQKDVVDQMMRSSNDSSKRVSLIKSFSSGRVSARRVQDALVIFQACPDKVSCIYNAMMDVCISAHDMETAQKILSQATKAGMADIVTYNTMVKACLQDGSSTQARKAIAAMKSAGFQPNCVTFNELLDAAVKKSIAEAWIIVEEMNACSVKPNHITCSILLKSIQRTSKSADVEWVLEVLDNMDDDIDEVLLSSVVEACIRAGRGDLLIPQLKRQRSSRKVQVKGPHTYGSIIRAYGFVQDVEGVWDTWREMRTRHIQPTSITLGCMVEALALNGDPEAGYELINQMLLDSHCKSLVNAVIYCSVLKGFSHQKRFDRVWTVYQEMLGLKLQFSIVTFNTLIDACARSGEMARIPKILESMVGQGIQPNIITYSAILKGYCQENRLDEAFQVLQDMLQTTSFKPDEIMYNTLLDGCARQGLYERGMKLLKEMQDAGIRPSNFTLSVLVKLASRGKMLDRAFELCEELSRTYKFRLNTHVYSNLVQACINHSDLPRALNVLQNMVKERVRPEVRTYSLLIKAFISVGDGQSAADLVRSAMGLADGHKCLAGLPSHTFKPQGGLPGNLLSEALEGIASHDNRLALTLLKDLKSVPNLKLPPQCQLRLATGSFKR